MHRDPHPRLIADQVVEFNPKMDYKLEIPLATETPLEGEIEIRSGKNAGPIKIIHRPRVMIASLEKDVPVTLYLKKYSMRPAYYLIGVFPLGVEKRNIDSLLCYLFFRSHHTLFARYTIHPS